MEDIVKIGSILLLNDHNCTVIPYGSEIEILDVRMFEVAKKVFVTFKDIHRKGGKHQDEDIVATLEYTHSNMFVTSENLLSINIPSVESVLVKRYIQVIKTLKPEVIAEKALDESNGSRAKLPHILWMLEKMDSPGFKHLTTPFHWIAWIQNSLYVHGLISTNHERDITRDIIRQYERRHEC